MNPANPLFFNQNVVIALRGLDSKTHKVERGVDTFCIDRGQFNIVTVVYDVVPKGIGAGRITPEMAHDFELGQLATV
jgi:hypothetical protein